MGAVGEADGAPLARDEMRVRAGADAGGTAGPSRRLGWEQAREPQERPEPAPPPSASRRRWSGSAAGAGSAARAGGASAAPIRVSLNGIERLDFHVAGAKR